MPTLTKKPDRQALYISLFLYLCYMKNYYLSILALFICQFYTFGGNNLQWKAISPGFDSLNIQLEEAMRSDDTPSQYYPIVNKMYRIAQQKKNDNLLARTLYWESWIQLKNDKDSAETLIKEALEKVDTIQYKYDYARILFNYSNIQISHGKYLQAYLLNKKLEDYFNEIEDYLFLGKTCINIGYILNGLEEYQEPLIYLQKAKEAFIKGNHEIQAIKNELNIANVLSQQGKHEKAIEILNNLLKEDIVQNDTLFLISVIVSTDCMDMTKEMHKKYAQKAYQMAEQLKNEYYLMYTSVNLGGYYLRYDNKHDSALYFYQKAYNYLKKNNDAYITANILQGLSDCYDCLNQSDSAYYYLKYHNLCKDSLAGNNKIIEINKIEGRYAIEKYESELKQAREKTSWHRKMSFLITMSLTTLSLLLCYIFWLLYKKGKINQQLKETENRELSEHLKTETLQNERFQMEIDLKNRKLTSNTLIIAEKNQTLKKLMKEIEALGSEGILPPKYKNSLTKDIKNHLASDDEWQFFKIHFEKVHPDFFTALKNKYPTLSENELHLCAYIRIGMSSKQIASMLSVLPETINMARYRMRKKMEVEQETSLEDFLRTL